MNDQDKKLQIMQAAERLCKSGRFHEVTTDGIAREANVGKGTIYRFFKDKDDLFFQTAKNGLDELCDLLDGRRAADQSFEGQLRSAAHLIGEFFNHRKRLFRVVQAEENRLQGGRGACCQQLHETRRRLLTAIVSILALGAREGRIRRDVPGDVLAVYFLGMVRTRFRHLGELPESWRECDVIVNLFLQGAAPPAGRCAAAAGRASGKGRHD